MAEIEIYTTRYCPYCHAAKRLLSRKGVKFREIDVSGDQKGRSEMVARANGRMTVPQIFIGSPHVGGCDDLSALDRAGKAGPRPGRGGARAGRPNLWGVKGGRRFAAIAPEEKDAPLAAFRELARKLGIFLHVGSLAIKLLLERGGHAPFFFPP